MRKGKVERRAQRRTQTRSLVLVAFFSDIFTERLVLISVENHDNSLDCLIVNEKASLEDFRNNNSNIEFLVNYVI